jgi:tRNA G18 (ribose-2'-O)-methylase SpoU
VTEIGMREREWQSKLPRRGQNRGRDRRARQRDDDSVVVLYGWHTVTAALTNPKRRIRRLLATENALRRLADEGIASPMHSRRGSRLTPCTKA